MRSTDGPAHRPTEDPSKDSATLGASAFQRRLLRTRDLLLADEARGALRHDLLNRLTGLGALTYQLRQKMVRSAGGADEGTDSVFAGISRQLAMFTEELDKRLLSPPAPGSCDVACVVSAVVALARDGRIAIDPRTPGLAAEMDAAELGAAIWSLIENAVDAIEGMPNGAIVVRCYATAGGIVLEVEDSGRGLSAEAAERAFLRFFTSKAGHAGLGLNVAMTVAKRANGKVELAGRADGGCGVRASLTVPAPNDVITPK